MAHQHTVTLKLPSFWSTQPRSWFTQAEAQFIIKGIVNDDTKYYYILASLDQDTAARLLHLLENPPTEGKYRAIKTGLLDTFGLSELERASQILHIHLLGAAKPSKLMDEMLALLGHTYPAYFTNNYCWRDCLKTSGPNWLQSNMTIAGPCPSKQTYYGLQKKWPLQTHWRNWKKQIPFFPRRNCQPLNPTSNQNTVFITGNGERKPKYVKIYGQ